MTIYSAEFLNDVIAFKERTKLTWNEVAIQRNVRSGSVLKSIVAQWRRGSLKAIHGPLNNKLFGEVEALANQGYFPKVIAHKLKIAPHKVHYYLGQLGLDTEMCLQVRRDLGMVNDLVLGETYRDMRYDQIFRVVGTSREGYKAEYLDSNNQVVETKTLNIRKYVFLHEPSHVQ